MSCFFLIKAKLEAMEGSFAAFGLWVDSRELQMCLTEV
jgi:hypothetical protein